MELWDGGSSRIPESVENSLLVVSIIVSRHIVFLPETRQIGVFGLVDLYAQAGNKSKLCFIGGCPPPPEGNKRRLPGCGSNRWCWLGVGIRFITLTTD
jgi:hypothetical protein